MRKDAADIHRRAQVSRKSNQRHLEAMAPVKTSAPLKDRGVDYPFCGQGIQRMRIFAMKPFALGKILLTGDNSHSLYYRGHESEAVFGIISVLAVSPPWLYSFLFDDFK
jgi:hypothetical protein